MFFLLFFLIVIISIESLRRVCIKYVTPLAWLALILSIFTFIHYATDLINIRI